MSKYDQIVQNTKEVHAYLERMVNNAKQKGIMITAVFVNAPILEEGTDVITPYGQRHPELVIKSCAKVGLKMIEISEGEEIEFDC